MSDHTQRGTLSVLRGCVGRDLALVVLWAVWAWLFADLYVGTSLTALSFVASLLVGGLFGVGPCYWVRYTDRGRSIHGWYASLRTGYRAIVAIVIVAALLGVLALVVSATNAGWLVLAAQAVLLTEAIMYRLSDTVRGRIEIP